MRLAHRLLSGLLVASTAGLLACGGGDDGDDDGGDIDSDGDHYQYVANDVKIPTTMGEATEYGLDLGGGSSTAVDNALGGLLAVLHGLNLDIAGSVDDNVQEGGVIILADVQTTDLTAATGVGLRVYIGANPDPDPCTDPEDITTCGQHLGGDATFDVAADSPSDAVVSGAIVGGRFTGGPGNVTIALSLAEGAEPVSLDLIGAKADVTVTADGLMNGKLGGAITDEQIRNDVLPAVVNILGDMIAADCTGEAPACCTPDSAGQQLLDFLDTDDDCAVSQTELEMNELISATLLNPDLDMLNDGSFEPGVDQIKDSLSIGIGFGAVGASFTP